MENEMKGLVSMSANPVTLENNLRLGDLLNKNLQIPNYQRDYCWEEKQIKPFLESLWSANKTLSYHLGTIIVHLHLDKNRNEVWDIVDGQQRLITLSLLQYCLCQETSNAQCNAEGCRVLPSLLHCETSDIDMLWHVHEAAKTIKEWINYHPADRKLLAGFIFGNKTSSYSKGVCVTVLQIQEHDTGDKNLPLAWTFFNALNSGGKSLSDYDLLKAHHLRYLGRYFDNHSGEYSGKERDEGLENDLNPNKTNELIIQYKASRWDLLGEKTIPSLFGDEDNLYETAFANTFYLIRTWLRNRNVSISWMPADEHYCILNHYSALTPLTTDAKGLSKGISSGITGGRQFFDWSEYWLDQYQQFCGNEIIKRFMQVSWKRQQVHLLIIVRAVLFYYFCRFGPLYLADASLFILYRIGKLRNTRQRLNAWYGNAEKYVPRTIEALDESPSPEHFFYYCQMPSNRYAPQYDLKNPLYEMDDAKKEKVLGGWNLGPDWWKHILGFAAASISDDLFYLRFEAGSIGDFVCFKELIKNLLNEVAKDFGWQFDAYLNLASLNQGK